MKIAVASAGADLDAQADPRFGRCAGFVVVDTDTMEFEAIDNTAAKQGSGAGIAAAQLVANSGADAVAAGNFGPKAFQALSQGGLQTFAGAAGTVREVVEAFNAGQLQQAGGPTVAEKAGMGGGAGTGTRGMGGGTGMGRGGGMGGGMGRGAGTGGGVRMPPQPAEQSDEAFRGEIQGLKDQIAALQEQVKTVTQRLEDHTGD